MTVTTYRQFPREMRDDARIRDFWELLNQHCVTMPSKAAADALLVEMRSDRDFLGRWDLLQFVTAAVDGDTNRSEAIIASGLCLSRAGELAEGLKKYFPPLTDQEWLAENPRTVVDTSEYPTRVAEIRTRDDFEKFVWFCNWDEFKENGGLGYGDCEQGVCWTQKTPDDLDALRAVVEAAVVSARDINRYESRAEEILRAVNAAGF